MKHSDFKPVSSRIVQGRCVDRMRFIIAAGKQAVQHHGSIGFAEDGDSLVGDRVAAVSQIKLYGQIPHSVGGCALCECGQRNWLDDGGDCRAEIHQQGHQQGDAFLYHCAAKLKKHVFLS